MECKNTEGEKNLIEFSTQALRLTSFESFTFKNVENVLKLVEGTEFF